MVKHIIGLFDDPHAANAALQDLIQEGISRDRIKYLRSTIRDAQRTDTMATAGQPVAIERGAEFGGVSGALMGGSIGLLVGLGALVIPGIGPAITAGTWASTLAGTAIGAGLGAATGGLIGGLVGAGVSEEEAHVYAESVRRGSTLVVVETRSDVEQELITTILRSHHVIDLEVRRRQLRESGWTRFDERAEPYTGPWFGASDNDRDHMARERIPTS